MMLTLLTLTSALLVLATVYAITTNSKHHAILAGENTVVGLADPSADTLPFGHHQETSTRTDWHLTTVTELCAAEELLDVLEYQGYAERELVVLGNSCFAVRWR